jgi:dimethylamine--corrinoid protein Co-methyltransferase
MGMAVSHAIASGMNGIRAAGDLVARMQMCRGMRIDQAKRYVADKVGTTVRDLIDPVLMGEMRQDLGLGVIHPEPGDAVGLKAKRRIAAILEIDINCVHKDGHS